MDPGPDYSLFLSGVLQELDAKRSSASYQELCKSLCARFDLAHLVKLRSLLFYTACLDPCFPATLFRDKMRNASEDQRSRKLVAAADIVTMFNLIQMNDGPAKGGLPVGRRAGFRKNRSFESCHSDPDAFGRSGGEPSAGLSPRPESDFGDRRPFAPASASGSGRLLAGGDLKCRAASAEKLHHLPRYPLGGTPSHAMQSTYFPMEIDSESTTDQDSLQLNPGLKDRFSSSVEPFPLHSCLQKRSAFKEDFRNPVAFSPPGSSAESKARDDLCGAFQRRDSQKHAAFFNHSFELPYSNPYFESCSPPFQEKKRAKHESLDDLQASTYFGPTTVSECVGNKRTLGRHGRQSPWPVKSLSLNTDEGPDFEEPFFTSKLSKDGHQSKVGSMESVLHYSGAKEKLASSPSRFGVQSNGPKSQEVASVTNGALVDHREGAKRFKDKSVNFPSLQAGGVDGGLSVATQTDESEQRKPKHSYKLSEEDLELVSDDISDIFRFLDDVSASDSLGILQSSRYDSSGSLVHLAKSDGDSSPENAAAKLSKASVKLDRLFRSLENTDGELKASVYKLVLRIGEIEKKLESLSGVRGEISQVLSKLNKLDEKIQEPEGGARSAETSAAKEGQPESKACPNVAQCHAPGPAVGVGGGPEWRCSDSGGSNCDSLRMKALRKTVCTRRSSRTPNEDNGNAESKMPSICSSPRDWRASCPAHSGDDGREKDRNCKDRHRKSKEPERPCDVLQAHRSSKTGKEPYLVEQVFTPHRFPPSAKFPVRSSPIYAGMRLVDRPESKRTQPPSWPLEEYKQGSGDKGKLSSLDLQAQESLNPNHMEYWMEDIYSPGYDSLLKRKEAQFRRAKACKIGILIAAAACTVILVIVVPMCTMKS